MRLQLLVSMDYRLLFKALQVLVIQNRTINANIPPDIRTHSPSMETSQWF